MTLGQKLGWSFGALGTVTVGLAVLSLTSTRKMEEVLDLAANRAAKKTEIIAEISDGVHGMLEEAKAAQLSHSIATLEKSAGQGGGACSMCHQVSGQSAEVGRVETAHAKVHASLARLRPMLETEEGRQSLDVIDGGAKSWAEMYRRYQGTVRSDFNTAHSVLSDEMVPVLKRLDDALNSLTERQRKLVNDTTAQAAVTVSRIRTIALVLVAVCFLTIGGACFNSCRATRELRWLVARLRERADSVAAAASQVSGSGEQVARGAAEQAQALDEVSASGEEIHSTADAHVRNSRDAAGANAGISRGIVDAEARLQELAEAMEKINAGSAQMAQIIRIVQDVAFQTNLLALNAAIEAARAGEAGAGFAVVADEVRALAKRSTEAAGEVTVLIEKTVAAAKEGMEKVPGLSERFRAISEHSSSASQLASTIETGSVEQAQKVAEISERIARMQDVTRREAESAEQAASAGESLQHESTELNQAVDRLVEMVGNDSRQG